MLQAKPYLRSVQIKSKYAGRLVNLSIFDTSR